MSPQIIRRGKVPTILDEAVSVGTRGVINFTGAGVAATDDPANNRINVTIAGGGTGDLKADGTVPLTANWDVGAYKITANQLESDVAQGTAPIVVASSTEVSNLNVGQLGGVAAAAYATTAAATVLITTHAGSTAAHIGGAGTVASVAAATALITTHAGSADPHSVYLLKQMAENDPLLLDEVLSADGKYSGICEGGLSGTALAFGDVAYLAAASTRWNLAVASSATTSRGKLGVCVLAATAAATTTMLLWGKVRADAKFPALPIGEPIYLSAGTAGVVTGTVVSGTTDYVVRIVGYGNTGDSLYFKPDNTYLELV